MTRGNGATSNGNTDRGGGTKGGRRTKQHP